MLISIVRHGRTAANAGGRIQGRIDNPLDPTGVRQAHAAAALVGPADLVVSSPLRRARETAALVAGGVTVVDDERWLELDYGDWDGRRLVDLPPETWQRWRADLDFAPPGGESLRALGTRVRSALVELADDPPAGHVVVVTHVSPVKAAFAWALGVGDEVGWRTRLQTASVTRVLVDGGRPTLLSFNEVPTAADVDAAATGSRT